MTEERPTLGDLIRIFYEEFLALYGDEDLAATLAAEAINRLLEDDSPWVSRDPPPEG